MGHCPVGNLSRGMPGTRAPHVELEHNGTTISTLDLYLGDFVVMAGPDGAAWLAAAATVTAMLGVTIQAYQIGSDALYQHPTEGVAPFIETYGIGPTGASLVRPDGYVAWRAANDSSAADLLDVVRQVLSLR